MTAEPQTIARATRERRPQSLRERAIMSLTRRLKTRKHVVVALLMGSPPEDGTYGKHHILPPANVFDWLVPVHMELERELRYVTHPDYATAYSAMLAGWTAYHNTDLAHMTRCMLDVIEGLLKQRDRRPRNVWERGGFAP